MQPHLLPSSSFSQLWHHPLLFLLILLFFYWWLLHFERAQEWADLIRYLGKLQRTLNKYAQLPIIPDKVLVAKRLYQCLNPALPSGVQRAPHLPLPLHRRMAAHSLSMLPRRPAGPVDLLSLGVETRARLIGAVPSTHAAPPRDPERPTFGLGSALVHFACVREVDVRCTRAITLTFTP